MKKYLVLSFFTVFAFGNDIGRYTEQLNEVTAKRGGLTQQETESVVDPFQSATPTVTVLDSNTSTQTYRLLAIFGNRAKINDKWYKVNDRVDFYELQSINKNGVILKDQEGLVELNITRGSSQNVSTSKK